MLSLCLAAALGAAGTRPDILLVTIDTLRADRVGAYGYAAAATPALDALARDGVLVEDAVVHVPQTRPSHASLFTGRLPYEHGIRDNASPPLERRFTTLAERLARAGWATGAFVGAYPVSRDSGLDRGFAVFDDPFSSSGASRQESRSERRAAEVVDACLRWLSTPRDGPTFAWVHLFDPHAPYEAPSPYRERFAKRPYDGEVAYADAQLARLVEFVERSGRRDSTLVVVTSDHGEGLSEHEEDEHLFFVYDSTLRVPLLLRWPQRLPAGARVRGQFRGVDMLPTLVELVGLPPAESSGASRAAELRQAGRIPANESYAESLYAQLHYGYAPLRALRGEGWKLIDAPRAELYHLESDPGETRNRIDDRGQVAAAMRARLGRLDTGGGAAKAAAAAADPEASERLAALGYVGGGFFSGTPSGLDPKDGIQAFQEEARRVRHAVALFAAGDYAAVVRTLVPLTRPRATASGPERALRSFNVSFYLGRALVELGRFGEALPHLTEAVALGPKAAPAYLHLASAERGAGRATEALATVERGLAVAPGSAELHLARGRLLLERGDTTAARGALERARGLDPRHAPTRVALADLYRGEGRLEAALAEAEAACAQAPRWSGAHVARGLVLAASGREREAEAAFREALRLEADQPDALFLLAAVERRAGRPAAAVPLLERLVAKAPSYPGATEGLAAARREAGAGAAVSPAVSPAAPPPAAGEAAPEVGTAALRLLRVARRDRAEALLARLRAGEDFAAVAREASEDASAPDGGWVGSVRVAELRPPLGEAAAALRPGETSGVLAADDGYFVLRRER
jgi:arylsulfatase A-like enzyme/Flp pilus assembly protein TadD